MRTFISTKINNEKTSDYNMIFSKLLQLIYLYKQRGNAASIRGTFPDSALLSEKMLFYVKF
jgi:hypothetical protein